MPEIVGYCRVSTDGQTLDAQITELKAAGAQRLNEQLAFDPGQRRTMPSVRPPPHTARLWRDLFCPELTVVAKLAANVSHGPELPAFGAGALRPVPETVAVPTRYSSIKKVERADATST